MKAGGKIFIIASISSRLDHHPECRQGHALWRLTWPRRQRRHRRLLAHCTTRPLAQWKHRYRERHDGNFIKERKHNLRAKGEVGITTLRLPGNSRTARWRFESTDMLVATRLFTL